MIGGLLRGGLGVMPSTARWVDEVAGQLAWALAPFVVLLVLYLVARRNPRLRRLDLDAYLYLYPALLILFVFHILPIFYSFGLSLYKYTSPYRAVYVGLENYASFIGDREFWVSLANTFYFALLSVPLSVVLSLLVAVLLNAEIRGKGIYRTVYFLPVITSIAAVSVVWKWVYNSDYGLLNHVLGLERFEWLQQNEGILATAARGVGTGYPWWLPAGPSVAMLCVVAMSVWKGLGYNVVIFLAGLQNIPKELYESAHLDGAGPWGCFRHVTWPLLTPVTYFIFVITTLSSFQVFAQIFMLYDGLPSDSTKVIVFYLYDVAFKRPNGYGYASALAYVLFGILFAVTMLQRRVAESRVHYQ